MPQNPLKVFISYSHKDREACEELKSHLQPFVDQHLIVVWVDDRTLAGEEWEGPVSDNLNSAHLTILLLSPSFINSLHCKEIEMRRAFERAKNSETVVIPILYKTFKWEQYDEIRKCKILPLDGKAIVDWKESRDYVWKEVMDKVEEQIVKVNKSGQSSRQRSRSDGSLSPFLVDRNEQNNRLETEFQIFISYAREDEVRVKEIYHRLKSAGYEPWLHQEHLIPGQKWELMIKSALKRSAFALICLSAGSINKLGFLQKEIKQALEHADEKLEDDVWLIPARLDDCEVPEILGAIQWIDLFLDEGFNDLLRALEFQLKKLGKVPPRIAASSDKTGVRPMPVTTPSLPKPDPPAPPSGARLKFTTVKVDESGKIVAREEQERPLIIEDLGGVQIELVEIPGGEFWMGSTSADAKTALTEAKRWYDGAKETWYQVETPRHRVRVAPFAMGRYQVTQEQWLEVMGDLPEIEASLRGDRRPVVNVNWEEATRFCVALSQRSGSKYRLPTEAEWEYAARAGTNTAFWCGPVLTPEVASYDWSHPFGAVKPASELGQTWDVGKSGLANPFGLADVHGNVWEWCADWYGEKYYAECQAKGTVEDPTGPGRGSFRVLRGGGWRYGAVHCRSAHRAWCAPGYRYGRLGFRLVRIGR